MADITLSILQLSDVLKDELVQTGNYECNLLKVLPVIPARNANNVTFGVKDGYETDVAETFAEAADVSSYTRETQSKASLSYGRYRNNKSISGSAWRQGALSPAPLANIDLIAQGIKDAVNAVTQKLGTDSFTGTGGNGIVGLETAIDVSTSYAGISRASATGWRSVEVDAGGDALGLADLRNLILSVRKRSGSKPAVLVGSFDAFDSIMALADSNFRVDFNASEGDRAASKGLSLGFDFVRVLGVDFIADKNCPDGEIFAIGQGAAHWEYVPATNDSVGGYSMVSGSDSVGDRLMLPFMLHGIGKTGDSIKFSVLSELALVVTKPHTCGKLTNFL